MAIVVEEDTFLLGVPAQRCAKLFDFIHSGVEALLVSSLWWKKKGDICHKQGRDREAPPRRAHSCPGSSCGPCTSGPKAGEECGHVAKTSLTQDMNKDSLSHGVKTQTEGTCPGDLLRTWSTENLLERGPAACAAAAIAEPSRREGRIYRSACCPLVQDIATPQDGVLK